MNVRSKALAVLGALVLWRARPKMRVIEDPNQLGYHAVEVAPVADYVPANIMAMPYAGDAAVR